MTLPADDQGNPIMPMYGTHEYIFRDINFQELLSKAEGVVTECKLHLVQYKAGNAGMSDEIAAASCLQTLQGGAEEIRLCAEHDLPTLLPLHAPVVQPAGLPEPADVFHDTVEDFEHLNNVSQEDFIAGLRNTQHSTSSRDSIGSVPTSAIGRFFKRRQILIDWLTKI